MLFGFVLAFALHTFAQAQTVNRTSAGEDCSSVEQGKSVFLKTEAISSPDGKYRVWASVDILREPDNNESVSCAVRFQLMVSESGGEFRSVYTLNEKNPNGVEAVIVGFSPDGSKLAANFAWGFGDYDDIRPVIYDLKSKKALYQDLGSRIFDRLPSCDYFQKFIGITNQGEAIIHIPRSAYVDEGCPDQGDWLFNLKTGRVKRRK